MNRDFWLQIIIDLILITIIIASLLAIILSLIPCDACSSITVVNSTIGGCQ